MLKLSANLSFLFTELPFLDRFAAASRAGFKAVEYMFPYDFDADEIRCRLDDHHLEQVLFNLPAGDWAAGERGIACLPGREAEFRRGVERVLQLAKKLGVRRLNALAGLKPATASDEACRQTLLANLAFAADAAAVCEVQILVEPINSRIDMPGFWLDTPAKAMTLLNALQHPNLFLQYDVYHAHVMGDDVLRDLPALLPRVGHLQVADHPGRHQPGSGEIPYPKLFELLTAQAYNGWIGCEYWPSGHTLASLDWALALLASESCSGQPASTVAPGDFP